MKQLIVYGMIVVGITYMVVSCFIYSMKREDKGETLELIEDVGYVVVLMIVIMFLSLMMV